jgi:hypothetical protein
MDSQEAASGRSARRTMLRIMEIAIPLSSGMCNLEKLRDGEWQFASGRVVG